MSKTYSFGAFAKTLAVATIALVLSTTIAFAQDTFTKTNNDIGALPSTSSKTIYGLEATNADPLPDVKLTEKGNALYSTIKGKVGMFPTQIAGFSHSFTLKDQADLAGNVTIDASTAEVSLASLGILPGTYNVLFADSSYEDATMNYKVAHVEGANTPLFTITFAYNEDAMFVATTNTGDVSYTGTDKTLKDFYPIYSIFDKTTGKNELITQDAVAVTATGTDYRNVTTDGTTINYMGWTVPQLQDGYKITKTKIDGIEEEKSIDIVLNNNKIIPVELSVNSVTNHEYNFGAKFDITDYGKYIVTYGIVTTNNHTGTSTTNGKPLYADGKAPVVVSYTDPNATGTTLVQQAANFTNGINDGKTVCVETEVSYKILESTIPDVKPPVGPTDPDYPEYPDPDFAGTPGIFVSQDGTGNGGSSSTPIALSLINAYVASPEYTSNVTANPDSKIAYYRAVNGFSDAAIIPENIGVYGFNGVLGADANAFAEITVKGTVADKMPKVANILINKGIIEKAVVKKSIVHATEPLITDDASTYTGVTFVAKSDIDLFTAVPTNTFTNCIFWKADVTAIFNAPTAASCTNCASNDNSWTNGTTGFKAGRIAKDGINNIMLSSGNGEFYGPKFTEPTTPDFSLSNESILINRGTTIVKP